MAGQMLEMCVQASFIICVVLVVRLVFLKLNIPKRIIYFLWAIPLIRLIIPFSVTSQFSLMPQQLASATNEIEDPFQGVVFAPSAEGTSVSQEAVPLGQDPTLPPPEVIVEHTDFSFAGWIGGILKGISNMVWDPIDVFCVIWLIGIFALVIYSVISTVKLRKKLAGSVRLAYDVYQTDYINTPFVLGIFRPRIYLPTGLSEADSKMILCHEKMHIKRRDHIVKFIAYVVTCIYWFNPLIRLMYVLFCRDMENAVDEKVISAFDLEERKTYATLLLALSVEKRNILSAPLAFGEEDVKRRIINITKYKKPVMALVVVAIIVIVGLVAALLTNPVGEDKVTDTGKEYHLNDPIVDVSVGEKSYAETEEDIARFASDFISDFNYAVYSGLNKSFETYVDGVEYIDLLIYIEQMQRYTSRQSWTKASPFIFDKHLKISSDVEVTDMGEHYYLVKVPYTNQRGIAQAQFLVHYELTRPRIENMYLGVENSVDGIAAGSPEEREITNPEKWKDTEWTEQVFAELETYGNQLVEMIQQSGIPYYAGLIVDYYQDQDGMWVANGNKYYYRLVLGCPVDHNTSAAYGSAYVVLSNDLNITYEEAFWASGISSNLADYFSADYAQIVDWQFYDRPVTELQVFTYNGDDPIMRAICNYMVASDYQSNQSHGTVQIPAPVILKIDDSDPSDIKVWGNFWSYSYVLEGTRLMTESGGEWPGLMHIAKNGDRYVVTEFDRVGDGSNYTKDMRRISKGHIGLYQKFLNVSTGDSKEVIKIREQMIRSYVNYYDLNVDSYQDFGWDPVKLD